MTGKGATEGDLILVAEDHPVNQKIMALLLEMAGLHYEIVSNGKEAVQSAKNKSYGLILMDIMMPEMDGFEASFEIRTMQFGRGRHTPIIAVTAMDRRNVQDQCIRSGIDDYIAKPISQQILKEKIEHWLHRKIVMQSSAPAIQEKVVVLNKIVPAESDGLYTIDKKYLQFMYGLEQLEDILALFLTVTESLLAQLESAIKQQDVSIVRRMAHEIKGSSYAISASEMATLCRDLEKQGEEQNWPEAARTYAALGLAFARVRQYLENEQQLLRMHSDREAM